MRVQHRVELKLTHAKEYLAVSIDRYQRHAKDLASGNLAMTRVNTDALVAYQRSIDLLEAEIRTLEWVLGK